LEIYLIIKKSEEYKSQKSFEKSLQSLNLKLTIYIHLYGLLHPLTSFVLHQIGQLNISIKNYDYALLCCFASLRSAVK
jgi:hypothetical protein